VYRKESLLHALVIVALVVATKSCFTQDLRAQRNNTAAEYLPATTALYLQVQKPAELIKTIENHAVVKKVLGLEQIKDLLNSPEFAMAMLGRTFVETQLGQSIQEALRENTEKGLWVAFDPESEGIIIVFRAREEARLKKVAGTILNLVKQNAEGEGGKSPFERVDYRDAVAAKFDDFLVARYQDWFAITNKPKLAKTFVDNLIDGVESPLSSQTWFKDATSKRGDSDVWAAIDMDAIRKIADNPEAFSGRTDNPGVELIFGGVLDALKNSPNAFAELNIGEQIDLTVSAPFETDWVTESREYFFGKELKGMAPKALSPKKMIANLTSHRDLGLWWLSKEDLYAENVIAELAQADSQLSTIFSGMNFGEDVLGALEPGVQIVVAENNYDERYVPDVKIPAFALVGKLKDAGKMQRRLKIAFQSVVGFANINLGMNGQPQLDLETENIGDTKVLAASYFYEEGTEEGLLLFNFTPTIAFRGSDLILASNRDLAIELAELSSDQASDDAEDANTKLKLDGKMLHRILDANAESLIAQNMLEEGNDRKAASEQIGILLQVAKLLRDFQMNYRVNSEEMELDLTVRFEVD
jgi:hypothetical protein